MIRAIIIAALFLGGCAATLPSVDPVDTTRATCRRNPQSSACRPRAACPALPAHVRAEASRQVVIPGSPGKRDELAADAVVGDTRKARALADAIAAYDRCAGR